MAPYALTADDTTLMVDDLGISITDHLDGESAGIPAPTPAQAIAIARAILAHAGLDHLAILPDQVDTDLTTT